MPADNLEIFKKVIFRIPTFRKSSILLTISALFYSAAIYYLLDAFLLDLSLWIIPLLLAGFIVPSVVASELYCMFLPGYPRKWGYFLSLVNQLMVFLFAVLLVIPDSFYTAWQIVWLALTTLFISNFIILLLSTGPENMKKVSVLSLVYPVILLVGFHVFLGRALQIGLLAYLTNFLAILGVGVVLLIAIYATDFLVGSNVSNISILNLVAALLQNRQEKLDLGRSVRPDIQTLKIRNGSGEKTFVAPWVHPGPLQGFGGGRLTSYLIDRLNSEGEGFFLHVPSCHQMDPADPGDSRKIYEAIGDVETTSQASKLLKKEYDLGTFYGRRIGDRNVVYMEVDDYDDYESAVFNEVVDTDTTLVVDLHNQKKGERLDEMRYGTRDAAEARKNLKDFLSELQKLEVDDYSAGFAIDSEDKPVAALVEEVDKQRTLMFGIEGNDASESLLELREEFAQDFDHVLLFTTDTHSSIHDLASSRQVGKEKARSVVNKALEDLSDASAGLSSSKAEEMKFLKDDYYGLVYTINILVRLLPIAMVLLYIALVIWLL